VRGPCAAAVLGVALVLAPGGGASGASNETPGLADPTPRLQALYDIAVATPSELRRIDVENASVLGIGIGDTLRYLRRRMGKPRLVSVKDKGTKSYHRVFTYDDVIVRVDADNRISRIKVMASGAWIMRNAVRDLMTDFSERRMQQVLGWNYRRKLKRVYVWPISRKSFMQDKDRERLLKRVRQYYKFKTREQAEKKIIRAWDTVYIYSERGLRLRVYSNIPVSGRFKADFVLIKPVPFAPAGGPGKAPPMHGPAH
jgi:hypothetical protein